MLDVFSRPFVFMATRSVATDSGGFNELGSGLYQLPSVGKKGK